MSLEEIRRHTPHDVFRFAERVGAVRQEEVVHSAWLTAMLTATGTNAPKHFPKSPAVLLQKSQPPKKMSPKQWEAMIRHLTGGNRERPKKADLPKYPPRQE